MSLYYVQFFILFIIFYAFPCRGEGEKTAGTRQELVCSQSDGLRHEIYSSSWHDDMWIPPVKITENNADNLHPVMDIGPDGTKWLFWSAVRPDGISVEYAFFQENAWSEPQKLPMEQHSAITPSVLIEADGTVWLVWAGNDGGNDDIYYTRYQAFSWRVPKVLHAANKVPDIKPEIAYNKKGEIEVSWLGFRDRAYKQLVTVYTDSAGWSTEQEKVETEEENNQRKKDLDRVELPSFLTGSSQCFLKIY
ncbi:MAG: hypothetical protein D3924_18405 [Candidatus Electrothrix sp. AR4]|nr:hypothetical protein [Candidatus Electrothrix sp. AR4]